MATRISSKYECCNDYLNNTLTVQFLFTSIVKLLKNEQFLSSSLIQFLYSDITLNIQ